MRMLKNNTTFVKKQHLSQRCGRPLRDADANGWQPRKSVLLSGHISQAHVEMLHGGGRRDAQDGRCARRRGGHVACACKMWGVRE